MVLVSYVVIIIVALSLKLFLGIITTELRSSSGKCSICMYVGLGMGAKELNS